MIVKVEHWWSYCLIPQTWIFFFFFFFSMNFGILRTYPNSVFLLYVNLITSTICTWSYSTWKFIPNWVKNSKNKKGWNAHTRSEYSSILDAKVHFHATCSGLSITQILQLRAFRKDCYIVSKHIGYVRTISQALHIYIFCKLFARRVSSFLTKFSLSLHFRIVKK